MDNQETGARGGGNERNKKKFVILHGLRFLQVSEMTELLLQWNKQLSKQQDDHGNTPLHFTVSVEHKNSGMLPRYAVPVEQGKSIATLLNITDPPLEVTKQLLEADPYSAYQPNKKGSFPIHIAAAAGRLSAVIIVVAMHPGCAGLRDLDGRTFLHVAAKSKRYNVVAFACRTPVFSQILNKQDNDGNTPLHLAVEVGDWWVFACLFVNKQVDLDLPNNRQHTPRDLSIISIPTGLYCYLNSRILIQETLTSVNATRGIYRLDLVLEHQLEPDNEEKGSRIVSDSTVSWRWLSISYHDGIRSNFCLTLGDTELMTTLMEAHHSSPVETVSGVHNGQYISVFLLVSSCAKSCVCRNTHR